MIAIDIGLARILAQLWGFEKQSASISWFGRWKYSYIPELSYKFKQSAKILHFATW